MRLSVTRAALVAGALALAAPAVRAQHSPSDHAAHHAPAPAAGAAPTELGQDALAAIAEVVRLLEADPSTDWSRVRIAALREHLVDMQEVALRAAATERAVPGGVAIDVTGAGRTLAAIRRMVPAHARQLDAEAGYVASAVDRPDGVRLTVLAADPADATLATRLRALGFFGLLVQGGHHGPHHVAMARGAGHH